MTNRVHDPSSLRGTETHVVVEAKQGNLLVSADFELLKASNVDLLFSHFFTHDLLLGENSKAVGVVLYDAERGSRIFVDVATSLQRCVGDVETTEERDVEEHDASGLSCVTPCHQPLLGGATILAR